MKIRWAAAALCAAVALAACDHGDGGTPHVSVPDSTPQLPANPARMATAHPLGAKWDIARADSYKPYLTGFNGGSTFFELTWCDVEPTAGVRNFSSVDSAVDTARAVGFTLSMKIRVGSCWATEASDAAALAAAPPGAATGGRLAKRLARRAAKRAAKQTGTAKGASAFPASLDTYRAFVTAVVQRYAPQGVHEYAIENEVNAPGHWAGTVTQYLQLVTVGGKTIKAADPQARVTDGGLGSTVYGQAMARDLLTAGRPADALAAYQRYYARRFGTRGAALPEATDESSLRAALRTDQAVRNLAYVDATMSLVNDKEVDAFQLHFYERWDNVPSLTAYLTSHIPSTVPIEAWEVGRFWPDAPADEQVHASETVKTVALLLVGGIDRINWLPLAYNPQGRNASELRFGLVDPDGSVRPSGKIFQTLAAATASSTPRVLGAGGVAAIAFERPDGTTVVAWSDGGHIVKATPPVGVTVVDALGQPITWPATGLELSSAPVVIHTANAGDAGALFAS